jgi:hypothetical protein
VVQKNSQHDVDFNAALARARRWPFPTLGRSEIEIRPLFEWHLDDETFAEKVS